MSKTILYQFISHGYEIRVHFDKSSKALDFYYKNEILGEDPRCAGFFYSCGYNSAGMMYSGGCGEQIAEWIIHGRPKKHMFSYDIRR